MNRHDGLWGVNMNGHRLRLCLSGMIPAMARARVDRFVERHPLDLLICSGLAGALRPEIAVDMESQSIAALCQARGIPCLALKAVSDGLEDDLSPILGGFDTIQIPRIAWRVLCRPATWPLAGQLARYSYLAATHLGHGVLATLTRLGRP